MDYIRDTACVFFLHAMFDIFLYRREYCILTVYKPEPELKVKSKTGRNWECCVCSTRIAIKFIHARTTRNSFISIFYMLSKVMDTKLIIFL